MLDIHCWTILIFLVIHNLIMHSSNTQLASETTHEDKYIIKYKLDIQKRKLKSIVCGHMTERFLFLDDTLSDAESSVPHVGSEFDSEREACVGCM